MRLRGVTADAKASGFTRCKQTEPRKFECERELPTRLVGVAAQGAKVYLGPPEGTKYQDIQKVPLEALRYEGVTLRFAPTQYIDKCLKREAKQAWERPIQCRTADEGDAFLAYALKSHGWMLARAKRWEMLVHADQLVRITLDRDGEVSLHEMTPADHAEEIRSARDRQAREDARTHPDREMQQFMRK
jgi:hypothetical protein